MHFAAAGDGAQAVAQPLHDGAADKHAALQCVFGLRRGLRRAGGDQAVVRGLEFLSGVHQHEAAGAIGVFDHAGLEAGLPEQGALLVAGDAPDGDGVSQQVRRHFAVQGAGGFHQGHQTGRNIQGLQQLGVPLVGANVEQHGARGVAHVGGMNRAAGQAPDQPGVDRAKRQFAVLRQLPRPGDVVQNPLEFGARKIGIHQQAGFGLYHIGQAALAQVGAGRFGAAVLPHDGVVDGQARFAVPDDRRLALVGDADGAHVAGVQAGLGQRVPGGGELGAPDFLRVVFDPARLRVDLCQFLLRLRHDMPGAVKNDAAGAGGALVEGK